MLFATDALNNHLAIRDVFRWLTQLIKHPLNGSDFFFQFHDQSLAHDGISVCP